MALLNQYNNIKSSAPFRKLLPPHDYPKLSSLSSSSARQWYNDKKELPALKDFLERLEAQNLKTAFTGFTTDGKVVPELFNYALEEGAPIDAMVEAATKLLKLLSADQIRETLFGSVTDDEIRIWSNPEFYVNPGE